MSYDEVVTAILYQCREAFIKTGYPDLPPVAYLISPENKIHIIPATVDRSNKHLFWRYVRDVSLTRPTTAVLMITGANFKRKNPLVKGDGDIDIENIEREALLAVLEPKNGIKKFWIATVHRAKYYGYENVIVDEWQRVDGGGTFEPMFSSTN